MVGASKAGDRGMRDALLLLTTLVVSLKSLASPVFGILAYICYGLLAPQGFTWYFARTFPHSFVIGLCTIFSYITWQEKKKIPFLRETIMLAALWVLFGISTVFAIEPEWAQTKFIFLSKIFLMVFLSMLILQTPERMQMLARVIALSLGFYAVKGAVFFIGTGGTGMVQAPEGSFLTANNSLGAALAMNAPLLFYLLRTETHVWLRRLVMAMLVCTYPAVIGTFSRGAWLALGAATALMIMKSKHKVAIVASAALLGVLVLIWFPQIVSDRVASRANTLQNYEEDASAQSRFWNWEFCRRVGAAHPLLGAGFNYYSLKAYGIYYPEFLERWPGEQWSCHSTWLTIWGEHGIPAFLIWVGLIPSCWLSLMKIRAYGLANSESLWMVHWVSAVRASMIAFFIAGTFVDFAYFDLYYELIGTVVILKVIVSNKQSESIKKTNLGEAEDTQQGLSSIPVSHTAT